MTEVKYPDPLMPIDELAESSSDMEFQAHIRTFNAMLSVAGWFIIHLAILLASLYFFIIADQPIVGTFGIFCAILLLIYGGLRRSSVRADVVKAIAAGPTARHHQDPSPGLGDRLKALGDVRRLRPIDDRLG